MIGFNLTISELKQPLNRRHTIDARYLSYPDSVSYLRDTLAGEDVSHSSSVTPWWSVSELIRAIEAGGKGFGTLIHGGGYPFLFTARGSVLISELAEVENSRQTELKELIDPRRIYFVEAWDLS